MRFRTLAATFAAVVLAVTGSLLPAGPAVAASDQWWSVPMHQGFYKQGMIRFTTPNICVHYKLDGVLNYTANIKHWYDSDIDTWLYRQQVSKVSISTVSLTIDGYRPNGSVCTSTRRKWSAATLKVGARGYSCTFNPSVSVGFPWAVNVSASWPTCGTKSLALYKTNLTAPAYHHQMLRSADVIHFDKQYQFSQGTPNSTTLRKDISWRCYGIAARIGITITGVGDDEIPTARSAACPGWKGDWGIFGGVKPVTYAGP